MIHAIAPSKQKGQTMIQTALKSARQRALAASKLTATTGALFSMLLAITPPAQAKPFLYVISYSHSGTMEECLAGAKRAMRKEGIDSFYDDSIDEGNRAGKASGYSSNEYLAVEIECDQKMGVTVLGVAGLDNDLAWKTYKALTKARW